MSRHLIWALAACVCLSACGKRDRAAGGAASASTSTATAQAGGVEKLTGNTPSSVSPNRPEAKSDKNPKAEFLELVEARKAKKAAEDKRVLVRGFLPKLREPGAWCEVLECKYRGDRVTMKVKYTEEQLTLMRGMPSQKPNGPCPRVYAKITGIDEKEGNVQAEIIDVYDVQPDPLPVNMPAGVDFIAMDDIFLRGASAVGKVADLPVRLDHKKDEGAVTHYALLARGCSPHSSWDGHFYVAENDKNRAALASIPKKPNCMRVRVRITKAPTQDNPNRWGAELIAIGDKKIRAPEPVPNP